MSDRIFEIQERENLHLNRKGFLHRGSLSSALRAAEEARVFQGTAMVVLNEIDEIIAHHSNGRWSIDPDLAIDDSCLPRGWKDCL